MVLWRETSVCAVANGCRPDSLRRWRSSHTPAKNVIPGVPAAPAVPMGTHLVARDLREILGGQVARRRTRRLRPVVIRWWTTRKFMGCRQMQLVEGLCALQNVVPCLCDAQSTTRGHAGLHIFHCRSQTLHDSIEEEVPVLHGDVVAVVPRPPALSCMGVCRLKSEAHADISRDSRSDRRRSTRDSCLERNQWSFVKSVRSDMGQEMARIHAVVDRCPAHSKSGVSGPTRQFKCAVEITFAVPARMYGIAHNSSKLPLLSCLRTSVDVCQPLLHLSMRPSDLAVYRWHARCRTELMVARRCTFEQ